MPAAAAPTVRKKPSAAKPRQTAAQVWAEAVRVCGSVRAAVQKFPELHSAFVMEANLPHIRERERRAAQVTKRCAKLAR